MPFPATPDIARASTLALIEELENRYSALQRTPYALFLMGPPGSGKTSLAHEIEKRLKLCHVTLKDLDSLPEGSSPTDIPICRSGVLFEVTNESKEKIEQAAERVKSILPTSAIVLTVPETAYISNEETTDGTVKLEYTDKIVQPINTEEVINKENIENNIRPVNNEDETKLVNIDNALKADDNNLVIEEVTTNFTENTDIGFNNSNDNDSIKSIITPQWYLPSSAAKYLTNRLSKRIVEPITGRVYNSELVPPVINSQCDFTMLPLVPEVETSFEQFGENASGPAIEEFAKEVFPNVAIIDCSANMLNVFNSVKTALNL